VVVDVGFTRSRRARVGRPIYGTWATPCVTIHRPWNTAFYCQIASQNVELMTESGWTGWHSSTPRYTLWHQIRSLWYRKGRHATAWDSADRLKIDRSAVRPRPWPPCKTSADLRRSPSRAILVCPGVHGQRRAFAGVRSLFVPWFSDPPAERRTCRRRALTRSRRRIRSLRSEARGRFPLRMAHRGSARESRWLSVTRSC
jgi:hypothetical protein